MIWVWRKTVTCAEQWTRWCSGKEVKEQFYVIFRTKSLFIQNLVNWDVRFHPIGFQDEVPQPMEADWRDFRWCTKRGYYAFHFATVVDLWTLPFFTQDVWTENFLELFLCNNRTERVHSSSCIAMKSTYKIYVCHYQWSDLNKLSVLRLWHQSSRVVSDYALPLISKLTITWIQWYSTEKLDLGFSANNIIVLLVFWIPFVFG